MLTDPDKFQSDELLDRMAQEIDDHHWFLVSSDFYIKKWEVFSTRQLIYQNELLLSMQQRGEVWYVEDLFAVYFFCGDFTQVINRLDEYEQDLVAA